MISTFDWVQVTYVCLSCGTLAEWWRRPGGAAPGEGVVAWCGYCGANSSHLREPTDAERAAWALGGREAVRAILRGT